MWKIIGQSRAVSLLQRGLETGSLAHAHLLVGPAHAGKMTLALNLARALNCRSPEPPCGQCPVCERIDSSNHADVQTIGLGQNGAPAESAARKEISIDRVRDIQRSASLPPFEGRCRVFIIDGAELLSLEAANCLLKTLEEPEDRVVFVLLTTNERLLPETVVSRCQKIELAPVPASEIEAALTRDYGVGPERARLLARLSRGCPGWAVSAVLDDSLLTQRDELLDRLIELVNADSNERFVYAAQLAAQFNQERKQVYDRLDLWLEWWRDLLMIKAGPAENVTNIDRLDTLSGMAGDFSLAQIRETIQNIRRAAEQLRQNVSPQLVLEVLMLDTPDVRAGRRVPVK